MKIILLFILDPAFELLVLYGLDLRSISGVSGTEMLSVPTIIRESRLVSESLKDGSNMRELFGVAATMEEKYFSCSTLDDVSPLAVPTETNSFY